MHDDDSEFERFKQMILDEVNRERESGIDADPADFFPGFSVTCQKCGSNNIATKNTIGWSGESGAWGSLDLVCLDCKNKCELFEP